MIEIAGVRLRNCGRPQFFKTEGLDLQKEDFCVVETERGPQYGKIIVGPREIEDENASGLSGKIVRKASEQDTAKDAENTLKEEEAFKLCQQKIAERKMQMKLVAVEYNFDRSRATFYFTAAERVDFRELVKDMALNLKTRIEMKHIGVRDEARMIGGYGPCGKELCCLTFLKDFEPVTIRMAKDQKLMIQEKISGMCGRLMCCLAYEQESYQEEKKKE